MEQGVRNYNHNFRWNILQSFKNDNSLPKDENGNVLCSNCGTITGAIATEIDHNVAIWNGGYDVLSNLRPLCHSCHMAKHSSEKRSSEMSRRIKEGMAKSDKKSGRPRSVPDNYKELLDAFVHCRISREDLAKDWGMPTKNKKGEIVPVDFVHLTEQIWYREYLDELGIEKVVNKVGHPTRDFYTKGIVGYIVYKTGDKEYMHYQPEAKAE